MPVTIHSGDRSLAADAPLRAVADQLQHLRRRQPRRGGGPSPVLRHGLWFSWRASEVAAAENVGRPWSLSAILSPTGPLDESTRTPWPTKLVAPLTGQDSLGCCAEPGHLYPATACCCDCAGVRPCRASRNRDGPSSTRARIRPWCSKALTTIVIGRSNAVPSANELINAQQAADPSARTRKGLKIYVATLTPF